MLTYYQNTVKLIGGIMMKKHQTTFHLEDKDKEAIAEIRAYYGATSDVAAVRLALREVQRQLRTRTTPAPQKEGLSSPE
jgi:hypothetical protein